MSITLIFRHRERLPLGNKDRGAFIPPEKGRRAIFVPSLGVLDKEEVDYIVEAEQEKEDDRIKKGEKSEQKELLERAVQLALSTPKGKRRKTLEEVNNGNKL